jgi:H+/Cl- antiporter ClcA
MSKSDIGSILSKYKQIPALNYLVKWLLLSTLVGILAGSASAFFLTTLDWVTDWRENNVWIIAFLPIAGLIIGLAYHYWGTEVVKGNNLLIEEFHNPNKTIPFKMAPLVLFGTIVTHLFGGSAGREGTAVQMGAAISDQFSKLFSLNDHDRKILLIIGISAGFAAVFGTPLAGAVFALEVMAIGKIKTEAILPSLIVAFIANFTCMAWNISHTQYSIPTVPDPGAINLVWAAAAGIIFGLTSWLFSGFTHFWTSAFKSIIKYAPFRPLIGGAFIALAVYMIGNTKYIGLGIPVIVSAFSEDLYSYDFLLKILFTSFTIGAGFKGGEVTPIFFIGATLGNALVWFVPLPMALLAGMGFAAVFSGATNTPIACTLLGIELFGIESALFIGIACIVSYLCSGPTGIYSSQIRIGPKYALYRLIQTRIKVLRL